MTVPIEHRPSGPPGEADLGGVEGGANRRMHRHPAGEFAGLAGPEGRVVEGHEVDLLGDAGRGDRVVRVDPRP